MENFNSCQLSVRFFVEKPFSFQLRDPLGQVQILLLSQEVN